MTLLTGGTGLTSLTSVWRCRLEPVLKSTVTSQRHDDGLKTFARHLDPCRLLGSSMEASWSEPIKTHREKRKNRRTMIRFVVGLNRLISPKLNGQLSRLSLVSPGPDGIGWFKGSERTEDLGGAGRGSSGFLVSLVLNLPREQQDHVKPENTTSTNGRQSSGFEYR